MCQNTFLSGKWLNPIAHEPFLSFIPYSMTLIFDIRYHPEVLHNIFCSNYAPGFKNGNALVVYECQHTGNSFILQISKVIEIHLQKSTLKIDFLAVCANILRFKNKSLNTSEISAKISRCLQHHSVHECVKYQIFGQEYRLIK